MAPVKILIIPGSCRTGSVNVRLAATALDEFVRASADVTRLSLSDYPLPIYDGDIEKDDGVPKPAIDLKRMISAHDGVLLVTPEYNASPPPLVKNMIDWVSRVQEPNERRGQGLRERPFAIAAASNGRLGGARCLQALRLVLTACGALVIPNQLALSSADQAYDETDRLKHSADIAAMKAMTGQLIDFSQQMKAR